MRYIRHPFASLLAAALLLALFLAVSIPRVVNDFIGVGGIDIFGFYPSAQFKQLSVGGPRAQLFLTHVADLRTMLRMQVVPPAQQAARTLDVQYNLATVAHIPLEQSSRTIWLLLPNSAEIATDGLLINLDAPGVWDRNEHRKIGFLFGTIQTQIIQDNRLNSILAYSGIGLLALALLALLYLRRRALVSALQILFWSKGQIYDRVAVLIFAVYATVMSLITIAKHQLFLSTAYDLGIFDQALWQIRNGMYPYSSTMGLHVLGDHAALILYPLALLYAIVSDVRILLIFQSVVIGLGVVPIYAIAKRYGYPLLGIAVSLIYVLHPSTLNMNLFDFHPDSIAATTLLFVFWFALEQRWIWMFAGCLIILMCKENFSITLAMFGVWLVLQRQWWRGGIIVAISAAWFIFAAQYMQPALNGLGYESHLARYGQFGGSIGEIIIGMLLNPAAILQTLLTYDRFIYVLALLAPFGFLALLRPQRLFIAAPAILMNVLADFISQITMTFHYQALIIAVIAVATIEGFVWLVKLAPPRRIKAWALGLCMLAGLVWVRCTSAVGFDVVANAAFSSHTAFTNYIVSLIPSDANISTTNTIQPHLSHREQSFLFPTPFLRLGLINVKQMPYKPQIQYIIYDAKLSTDFPVSIEQQQGVLKYLEVRDLYEPIVTLDSIRLLRQSTR